MSKLDEAKEVKWGPIYYYRLYAEHWYYMNLVSDIVTVSFDDEKQLFLQVQILIFIETEFMKAWNLKPILQSSHIKQRRVTYEPRTPKLLGLSSDKISVEWFYDSKKIGIHRDYSFVSFLFTRVFLDLLIKMCISWCND